jgi:hypothetical protein
VVPQMLDYAANAVLNWTVENVRNCFEQPCRDVGTDPIVALSELLRGEKTEAEFWELVKTSLGAQKIRLVFLADRIADELRTIVEFLNRQMSPFEVLILVRVPIVGPCEVQIGVRKIGHRDARLDRPRSELGVGEPFGLELTLGSLAFGGSKGPR